MILFMHGLDSSKETNKFECIDVQEKYCETIDYRANTYEQVSKKYDEIIKRKKPKILVGHSLGGYWALVKSQQHNIPCFLINPSLYPKRILSDYIDISEMTIKKKVKRQFHIELGDEVLNMVKVAEFAQSIDAIQHIYEFGCHRVQYLDGLTKEIREFYYKYHF